MSTISGEHELAIYLLLLTYEIKLTGNQIYRKNKHSTFNKKDKGLLERGVLEDTATAFK